MGDLLGLAKDYIDRMLARVPGMKVLLVDAETARAVAAAESQTAILQREVFLVERLDQEGSDQLMHMKAVCLVRPSNTNLRLLRTHFRTPRFGEYHLFFTNVVREGFLLELAEADSSEVVQQVQEYYMDYCVVDPHHFSVPVPNNDVTMYPDLMWDMNACQQASDKIVEGLAAVLLSLKKQPQIRFQRTSKFSERVAKDLWNLVYRQEQSLFATGRSDAGSLVLVLDRTDDPVTPLLNQWTYQAMVHELLSMENNRVDLSNAPKVRKDQQQVVLSASQDDFFRQHMHDNYGDLGIAVKSLVDGFQQISKSNQNIQSIEDMQKFVESYPEFRSKQGNVSKHVSLMSELSRLIDHRQLMAVSELEQEVACSSSGPAVQFDEAMDLLGKPGVSETDKVKLVMLFALKYEKGGAREIAQLKRRLAELGVSGELQNLVNFIVQHAGEGRRSGDLFSTKNFQSRFGAAVRKGLKGVDNVYTQHEPLLTSTLESAVRGKLPEDSYPFVNPQQRARPVRDVVVFIVGGSTFEEARAVSQLNQAPELNARVVLGGSAVLNSGMYLSSLKAVAQQYRKNRRN